MPPPANFDDFAAEYRELLDQSVAASGESGEYFAHYKARYAARVLGADFKGRILEFGCGIGLLTRFLLECLPQAQITGYDPSVASIASVPTAVAMKALFTSNAEQLGLDYDAIVIANVLHHVPCSERTALFHRLRKMLASHGSILLFEHNPRNPLTRAAVRDCIFDSGAVLVKPAEVRSNCRNAGLAVASLRYTVFFPHWLRLFRGTEPLLGWCPLGAQYAAVIERQRA